MLKFLSEHKYAAGLAVIIFIAIFFRFWQLGSTPPGLYPDEAMNGVDALDSLHSGHFSVFYQNNNGREGMIMWLDALAIKAFGIAPWVLRVFPALAGVLAVLGLYYLLKELFDLDVALAGSFFMATGFWSVLFSRTGFRVSLMIPILIWSFYLLLRGFNNQKYKNFILSGIIFGLGFYTYIAYRFAPLLAVLIFLPVLIKQKSKKLWLGTLFFVIAIFMIASPVGLYFLKNPSDFISRASEVSVFSQASPLKIFAENIGKTLMMFNFVGDYNWRHNFSGSPELFWPVGLLFLLGIYFSIRRFSFSDRFLSAWSAVLMLPVVLSAEGLPHALRSLALAPVAYSFAAIGLIGIYRRIQGYFDKNLKNKKLDAYYSQLKRLKKEILALTLFLLLMVAAFEFNKYFIFWAYDPNVSDAYSGNFVKEANYLNSYSSRVKKYIIVNASGTIARGVPMPAMTSVFITYGKGDIDYLMPQEINKIQAGPDGTIIVPLQYDPDLLAILRKEFKNSESDVIDLNVIAITIPPVKQK